MAEKYYRCDLTAVHETSVGGRMHSVRISDEMPNGVFCAIKGYEAGSTEIKTIAAPVSADKEVAIIMKPEINYDERFKADQAIGIFRNEAGAVVPAVILQNHDGIDLSQDYFGTTVPRVGEVYKINSNLVVGTQLTKVSDLSGTGSVALRVIGVKPSCVANFVAIGGNLPVAYNMIQLEVVIK